MKGKLSASVNSNRMGLSVPVFSQIIYENIGMAVAMVSSWILCFTVQPMNIPTIYQCENITLTHLDPFTVMETL